MMEFFVSYLKLLMDRGKGLMSLGRARRKTLGTFFKIDRTQNWLWNVNLNLIFYRTSLEQVFP
jgi:hypothetical protein